MMDRQQKFNFTYSATRQLSRSLVFPSYLETIEGGARRRVRTSEIHSVLQRIEDRSGLTNWTYATNPELAKSTSVSESQVKRIVRILDDEALILREVFREGREKTTRRMRPNWQGYLDSRFCSLIEAEKDALIEQMIEEAKESGGKIQRAQCAVESSERESADPAQCAGEVDNFSRRGRSLDDDRSVPGKGRSDPVRDRSVPGGGRSVPLEGPQRPEVRDLRCLTLRDPEKQTECQKLGNRVLSPKDFGGQEIDEAIALVALVPFNLSVARDWEFANKVAVLTVFEQWPQNWFYYSLETITNRKREGKFAGFSYFVSIFRRLCRENGSELGEELQRVFLPNELSFERVSEYKIR